MMIHPKVYYKHSDLFDKLNMFFGESVNLARIKFISLMILALCKVQTASFYKLSTAFESGAEALSCMRRIQRFIFCSMNYKEHKDNPKSFRVLTGLTHIRFSHLLPYFEAAHDDYLSEYELNAFIEKGILMRYGAGKQVVYAKKRI